MNRMLFLVPRMYTEQEFKSLVPVLPDDFGPRALEFWNYVEDKLQAFVGKIQRIYRDEICQGGEEALARLFSMHHENFQIVRKLVENGAVFEATEDSMLVAESTSWAEAMNRNPLDMVSLEMYQDTVRERDNYFSKRIDETLRDEETGLLFLKPGRTISLNGGVKIIKVCRFEPEDYLRSWQVQLQSKR
jgi:hypothetical protein